MAQDDDFLKVVFSECLNSMRFRSGTEYKLLHMSVIIAPIIITATIGINELIIDKGIFFIFTLWMVFFLITLTLLFTMKIIAEHVTYEKIGKQVKKIWTYFELFKKGSYLTNEAILDKDAEKIGEGKGYLKTLYILWAIAIITSIIILVLGATQYISYINSI